MGATITSMKTLGCKLQFATGSYWKGSISSITKASCLPIKKACHV